ncbi:GntR family transcriptional regulator [Gordonia liuliyuniae]|uniref:GntR family transcriptional regulator n=1 Tax=Gordonia liuliyuniae TaxID=2911517 RepID=A0ABS9INU8_9ACTN|nr:GntR family transcriptional regulator [Gordonia liuliyuniae]MCF8587234.1 GntR family transcriptional regulator [Gordonia liuliyuniae]
MESKTEVAAERAYVTTKNGIISGALPGGSLLSEVAVSADLGLSRTPVHEAFLRLAAEQLLDLQPRRGAVVRPVTPSEAADVLAMRHAIEAASAAQLFGKGGPDDAVRAEIDENLARQRDFVAVEDVDGFVDVDDEFHLLVVRASGNPIAEHFYEQLRARQQRLRNLLLRIDPANLRSSLVDHEELAACLRDGDTDRYSALLQAHFDLYQGAL